MKNKKITILLAVMLLLATGCDEDPLYTEGTYVCTSRDLELVLPPSVITEVYSIASESAVLACDVTDDKGYPVVERGICWSTSSNPTMRDNHIIDGTGLGRSLIITGLTNNTCYYARAYAINNWGLIAYGNEVCITPPTPITDIDGNVYNTVQIGTQCWMKENLRTMKYADGTSISHGNSISTTEAYYYYPGGNSTYKTYGLLYNWKAVMRTSVSSSATPSGVQGICPTGWHVPSDAEWRQMEMASGMSEYDANRVGYRGNIAAKLSANGLWLSSSIANAAGNLSAPNRNASNFSALPTGLYNSEYGEFRGSAYFWSATETNTAHAYCRCLNNSSPCVNREGCSKDYGLSVRCVKD